MSERAEFPSLSRQELSRRPVDRRVRDFDEFERPLTPSALRKQSSRCMDCGVPFCQGPHGCPLGNLIPEWNHWLSVGRPDEALRRLHDTNNFPELTGRLCPAPCESACVLGLDGSPVSIRAIELSLIEQGFASGALRAQRPTQLTGRRIAIVGSGPAGLAAAQQLARSGHRVTVIEKADRAGGLLRYGIPDFKLDKKILDQRLQQMVDEGVEFRLGIEVGKDVDFNELRLEYDAVCLTTGAEQARDLRLPGRELEGIHFAMDYLVGQNRWMAGLVPRPPIDAHGKRVVILGGGDTGSDCLGTALRQGCRSAQQFELLPRPPLERANETPWPFWPMKLKISHAHEEGGTRRWSLATTEFLGASGRVTGLRAVDVEKRGAILVPRPGSELEIEADLVLLALGFRGPRQDALWEQCSVERDGHGNYQTDARHHTSIDGVFVAGDARRGASLIVWAIAEGRAMAASVNEFLHKRS